MLFKKNKFAKLFAIMLVVALSITCFSVTAFAAVSGSGSATGSGATFYVYSPSSSWFAHYTLQVSGSSDVYVSIIDPNGRILTGSGIGSGAGYIRLSGNTTTNWNFSSAPAGDYKITYYTSDGGDVTLTFSLHDWYA